MQNKIKKIKIILIVKIVFYSVYQIERIVVNFVEGINKIGNKEFANIMLISKVSFRVYIAVFNLDKSPLGYIWSFIQEIILPFTLFNHSSKFTFIFPIRSCCKAVSIVSLFKKKHIS